MKTAKELIKLEEELKKDEEYLDKEFPKGETKFRGQAMVLLALAREQGRQEVIKIIRKEENKWYRILEKRTTNPIIKSSNQNIIQLFVREVLNKLKEKKEK